MSEQPANAALRRVLLPYATYGPYHIARFRATKPVFAASGLELVAAALFEASAVYRWGAERPSCNITRLDLPRTLSDDVPFSAIPQLFRDLKRLKPDVILVNGWRSVHSLAIHAWCAFHGVARIVVSDSQEKDFARRQAVELVKRRIIAGCSAAFVAGAPQAEYVRRLGFDSSRIFEGCDVVDNRHFAAAIADRQWTRTLLTVARFQPAKNLLRAASAFLRFVRSRPVTEAWSWVIVGYGGQEQQLKQIIQHSGGSISIKGFANYDELPAVYGSAGVYWQPSVFEPWGLTVNEAMASGLPVLVSTQCGCHPDLVTAGNGWTFDPFSEEAMVHSLGRMADDFSKWPAMGSESRRIVAAWDLERFAAGALAAVKCALRQCPRAENASAASILRR